MKLFSYLRKPTEVDVLDQDIGRRLSHVSGFALFELPMLGLDDVRRDAKSKTPCLFKPGGNVGRLLEAALQFGRGVRLGHHLLCRPPYLLAGLFRGRARVFGRELFLP